MRNLAKLYEGVSITDKIGRRVGQLSLASLGTLAAPERILGLDTDGQILSYSALVKQPFSYNGFMIC